MTLLAIGIGDYFGGKQRDGACLWVSGDHQLCLLLFLDKIALAMYRATPATREQLPRVYSVVERLTQKIGLPMPKIFVIPDASPNAFATGRNPRPCLRGGHAGDSGTCWTMRSLKACLRMNSAM